MREALESALSLRLAAGIASEMRLFEGFEGALLDFITRAATEWQADLVVLGTYGRHPNHLIMGSNAEAVTRACPVPVLIVPSAIETDFGRPALPCPATL